MASSHHDRKPEPKELKPDFCSNPLCSICVELPKMLKSGHENELQTFDSLCASAETCPCCAIILNAVPQWQTFVPDNNRKVSIIPMQPSRAEELLLDFLNIKAGLALKGVHLRFPSVEYGNRIFIRQGNLTLCTSYDSQTAKNGDIIGRKVLPRGNLSNVKLLLQRCLMHHQECLPPAANSSHSFKPRLPTRVIDVSVSKGDVSLLVTEGRTGDYLTLSHRWGTAETSVTTKDNLAAYQALIPWEALTQTFKDAVNVTRELGYQYLWVDSLCIIQNDIEDWTRETSRMADIYKHATLNLSAAVSTSGGDGIFPTRKHVNLVPLKDTLDLEVSQPWAFLSDALYPDFILDVAKGSLGTRAWCLQERLLSRRILHFGRDQLHWECVCAKWSESSILKVIDWNDQSGGEQRIPLSSATAFDESLNPPIYFHPDMCSAQISSRPVYGKWYRLVPSYTNRHMTVADDRLPALSGMARTFAEYTGDRYLAGIWLKDAAPGLLWQSWRIGKPFQPVNHSNRMLKVRSPSWSWAACDEGVSYPISFISKVSLDILGGDVELSTSDPYGKVTSGYLDVKGILRPLETLRGFQPEDVARKDRQLPMFTDMALHTEFDDCEDAQYDGVFCLFVADVGCGSRACRIQASCQPLHAYGLLLRVVEEGVYRRVGLAVVSQLDFVGMESIQLRLL